jgi:hypothetical protein
MFGVDVDRELESLMGVAAQTVGAIPADLDATERQHDYIRQMLNVLK